MGNVAAKLFLAVLLVSVSAYGNDDPVTVVESEVLSLRPHLSIVVSPVRYPKVFAVESMPPPLPCGCEPSSSEEESK